MKQDFKIMKILAENLRFYRKLHNLTQEELSELSHLNVLTVSKIERMEVWPQPETIESLAKSLEIKSSDLFIDMTEYHLNENTELAYAVGLMNESIRYILNKHSNLQYDINHKKK